MMTPVFKVRHVGHLKNNWAQKIIVVKAIHEVKYNISDGHIAYSIGILGETDPNIVRCTLIEVSEMRDEYLHYFNLVIENSLRYEMAVTILRDEYDLMEYTRINIPEKEVYEKMNKLGWTWDDDAILMRRGWKTTLKQGNS